MHKRFVFYSLVWAGIFLLTQNQGGFAMSLKISSPAFEDMAGIPKLYTCQGKDISPPLNWSGAPENTKSFAIIADDPDAPAGTWVHWVIFNIPASSNGLGEGIKMSAKLSDGAVQANTDSGSGGYYGPCPPPGKYHRYFFKLYALDTMIDLDSSATKEDLLEAMEGHILDKAELVGRFKR